MSDNLKVFYAKGDPDSIIGGCLVQLYHPAKNVISISVQDGHDFGTLDGAWILGSEVEKGNLTNCMLIQSSPKSSIAMSVWKQLCPESEPPTWLVDFDAEVRSGNPFVALTQCIAQCVSDGVQHAHILWLKQGNSGAKM
jgi:hypothetical protein